MTLNFDRRTIAGRRRNANYSYVNTLLPRKHLVPVKLTIELPSIPKPTTIPVDIPKLALTGHL